MINVKLGKMSNLLFPSTSDTNISTRAYAHSKKYYVFQEGKIFTKILTNLN